MLKFISICAVVVLCRAQNEVPIMVVTPVVVPGPIPCEQTPVILVPNCASHQTSPILIVPQESVERAQIVDNRLDVNCQRNAHVNQNTHISDVEGNVNLVKVCDANVRVGAASGCSNNVDTRISKDEFYKCTHGSFVQAPKKIAFQR